MGGLADGGGVVEGAQHAGYVPGRQVGVGALGQGAQGLALEVQDIPALLAADLVKHLPEVVVAVDAGGRLQGLERLKPLHGLLYLELQGSDVPGELGHLLQRPPGALAQGGSELGRRWRSARAQGGGQVVVHLRGRTSQIPSQLHGLGPHRPVDVVGGGQ